MAGARPSGTVTFLFTDIEGSTRLWDEHPNEMKAALARHDEIVRAAIESNGGYVFATGGDGFACAFHRPDEALQAAIDAQRNLTHESFQGDVDIRVRMGVHSGTADERDGDYFGEAPTRTARIMAAAWGGQILCSAIAGRLVGAGIDLIELGDHRLKDLAAPVSLCQVASPAGDHFPPVRSLNDVTGNLPLLLTSLVGRDDLVATLTERLRRERLMTLTGVGGVGKTRLALQLAAETSLDFKDGCWLVELAPVRQPHEVAEAIVATLGVAMRPGMDALGSVVDHLRDLELVLVLDNCEHLVGAASEVAGQILQSCPGVHILATSREGLGLAGEQMVAVPSLDAAEGSSPAVRLFIERAAALGAPQPTEADVPWIVELCEHLDGIPLAIELAAGRASVLRPEDMVGLLDDRFRLLTGQRGGRLERHQTLRAAVEWSYDLLDVEERHAFDRLGVFVGSFDLHAATAVAGKGRDSMAMIDTLASLIGRSLVQLDRQAGQQRYRLLETLRQYAVERLAEDGLIDELRLAHAQHHAAEVSRLASELKGPDQAAAFENVLAMVNDLRAAVAFATDSRNTELAASLVGPFHNGPCAFVHAINSLASDDLANVATDDPVWGMAVLNVVGWATYASSDPARVPLCRNEVARATAAAEPVIVSEAWRTLSALAALFGDNETAIAEAKQAIEVAAVVDEQFQLVNAQVTLAAWSAGFGDPLPDLAETAATAALELENPWLIGYTTFIRAYSYEMSDPDRALQIADEVRVGATGVIDSGSVASESVAGRVLLRRGDHRGALERLAPHLEMNHRVGLRAEFSYSAAAAAGSLAALGYAHEAAMIHAALSGKTQWLYQREAEAVAEAIITGSLDEDERSRLVQEGTALDFREAAELTLATVATALAN